MDVWWTRHNTVDLEYYTQNEFENYTECNPQLLFGCIENGKVNFDCEEMLQAVQQSQHFASHMKTSLREWGWSR